MPKEMLELAEEGKIIKVHGGALSHSFSKFHFPSSNFYSQSGKNIIAQKAVSLIKDGMFSIENFKKEALGEDEFFSELRLQGISQLGQVEEAIEESSGNISIFYYPEADVKYGLPIMPDSLKNTVKKILDADHYSCIFCAYTEKLKPVAKAVCPECKKTEWVKSSNKKRIR